MHLPYRLGNPLATTDVRGTGLHHERRLGTSLLYSLPRQCRIQVVGSYLLPARSVGQGSEAVGRVLSPQAQVGGRKQ